jgi:TolA-binding protein
VGRQRLIYGSLVGLVGVAALSLAQGPTTSPATGTNAAGAAPSDLEKVERVLAARRDYQLALEQLRTHYLKAGEVERAKWAEEELVQYHRIAKQAYRLDLDVPPPGLKAEKNNPEANELYRRAMIFKDKGWSGNDYLDNQRRAELLFQQILTSYPESSIIDDAAYQLGDLYEGKAYKQYRRAAAYFERSINWNPKKSHSDARIRAARLYDKYLREQGKAIDLYREVTTHETDPRWLAEANKRLAELSQKKY